MQSALRHEVLKFCRFAIESFGGSDFGVTTCWEHWLDASGSRFRVLRIAAVTSCFHTGYSSFCRIVHLPIFLSLQLANPIPNADEILVTEWKSLVVNRDAPVSKLGIPGRME